MAKAHSLCCRAPKELVEAGKGHVEYFTATVGAASAIKSIQKDGEKAGWRVEHENIEASWLLLSAQAGKRQMYDVRSLIFAHVWNGVCQKCYPTGVGGMKSVRGVLSGQLCDDTPQRKPLRSCGRI